MAHLGQTYDVETLPKSSMGSFEPLPPGWYSATIVGAELKTTKSGTGKYIAVRYDITGPTHQGRVVFGNLNIRNESSKAESIGLQQFGQILTAIGLAMADDTDQLIGGSLQIKLDIEKSVQYGDKNRVNGFKSIDGGAPPKMASSSVAASPAAAKAAPPWARTAKK
jgi:hypothetical protein